jgi:hypothetical protein
MKIQNSLTMNNTVSAEEELQYLRRALAQAQAEAARYRARLVAAGLEP